MYKSLNVNEMKTDNIYESPNMEVTEIRTEQAVLTASLTGEGINEWEDM